MRTLPLMSTDMPLSAISFHCPLVRQTWGPKLVRDAVRGIGLRQVTASGLPSPVGATTLGRSKTLLPSALRSLPVRLNRTQISFFMQIFGPMPPEGSAWGARQVTALGSPEPLGVSGLTG